MDKEALIKAIALAGSQSKLATEINKHLPDNVPALKQMHISSWLNRELKRKFIVPPEYILPICKANNWQQSPTSFNSDIYPSWLIKDIAA